MTPPRHLYLLARPDRIGRLAEEIWFLRNLLDERETPLTVVIPPLASLRNPNRAFFRIATRGLGVIEQDDEKLLALPDLPPPDWPEVEVPPGHALLRESPDTLRSRFIETFSRGRRPRLFLGLEEQERARGAALLAELGIPAGARIVTLHVREPRGPDEPPHSRDRAATLESYLPAIHELVRRGYRVVRLGEPSMPPLGPDPPGVLDLCARGPQDEILEPALVATSRFFVGVSSGRLAMARAFGTPVLATNALLDPQHWGAEHDLLLPKHYRSRALQRDLTWEEILSAPAEARAGDLAGAGIELRENSPHEILSAAVEMCRRIERAWTITREELALEARSRMILRRVHHARRRNGSPESGCSHFLSADRLATTFLRMHPGYLGHPWPPEPGAIRTETRAPRAPTRIVELRPDILGAFVTVCCMACGERVERHQSTIGGLPLGVHRCPRCGAESELLPEEFLAEQESRFPGVDAEAMTRLTDAATAVAEGWHRAAPFRALLRYRGVDLGPPLERELMAPITRGLHRAARERGGEGGGDTRAPSPRGAAGPGSR